MLKRKKPSEPPLGAKKKYKAHISKYVPCILKYVRPFFAPVLTGACGGLSVINLKSATYRV